MMKLKNRTFTRDQEKSDPKTSDKRINVAVLLSGKDTDQTIISRISQLGNFDHHGERKMSIGF